jgi:hypothetical protein
MPTHVVARTVAIDGETEYPTEAERLFGEHEGVTLVAGDGTPTNVWTGEKRRWKYIWVTPQPDIVQRMVALYTARGTFSHTDIEGATFTATIPVGRLRFKAVFDPASGTTAGTTYPNLEVEVWQT